VDTFILHCIRPAGKKRTCIWTYNHKQ